jgi:hypothetical protein
MSSTPSVSPQPPAGGPPAAAAAKSSGLKIFLWILGIFAGLMVLAVVGVMALGFFVYHKAKQAGLDPELAKKNPVLAAAKLSVALNPDTETVSSDDSSGTIIVRDKKTGKTSTMKVDPDSQTMTVTDDQGKTVTMKLDSRTNRLVITDDKGKTATITANTQAGNMEIKTDEGNVKIGTNTDKPPDWVPVYPSADVKPTFSISANGEQSASYTFTTKDAVDKVVSYYETNLKTSGMKTSNTISNSNGKTAGMTTGTTDNDKRTVVVMATTEDDGTHVNVTYTSKP